ncbi:MAG TPA: hypothetical protein VFZ61_00990 [Polyangiales bacterium]
MLLLLAGCSELPGETLGTYKVTMTLQENTCGEVAVFSLDKKRYSVELRSDENSRAYWRIPGQTPIQGRYEAPEFEFDFRAVVANAGPDAGPTGCRLVQRDQVSGSLITDDSEDDEPSDAGVDADQQADDDELDAGAEDPDAEPDAASDAEDSDEAEAGRQADAGTTLAGEHTMTITAEQGTDCRRDALMPAGPFERLPCKVRYKLTGVPTKPF